MYLVRACKRRFSHQSPMPDEEGERGQKKGPFESLLAQTLGAHALSAAVSSQPGPELVQGRRGRRDDRGCVAPEAQRARGGHPQACGGPGGRAEANLDPRQQSQGIKTTYRELVMLHHWITTH